MGDEIGRTTEWFYCLKHQRVEPESTKCKAKFLLGPYPDPAEAENALEHLREREERIKAEDRAWRGDDEPDDGNQVTAPNN